MSKDRILIIILIFFFILGALIRLFGHIPFINFNVMYTQSGSDFSNEDNAYKNLAFNFYRYIDNGEYDKAWEISIEPDWTEGKKIKDTDDVKADVANTDKIIFWNKTSFTNRQKDELGFNGVWLKLSNLKSQLIETPVITNSLIQKLFPTNEIVQVRMSGHIVTACTVYNWVKDVFIVKIEDTYKIFLPGTKKANSFFYKAWFKNE